VIHPSVGIVAVVVKYVAAAAIASVAAVENANAFAPFGCLRALFKFPLASFAHVVTVNHATFTRFIIFSSANSRLRDGRQRQQGQSGYQTNNRQFHLAK